MSTASVPGNPSTDGSMTREEAGRRIAEVRETMERALALRHGFEVGDTDASWMPWARWCAAHPEQFESEWKALIDEGNRRIVASGTWEVDEFGMCVLDGERRAGGDR